MKEIAYAQNFIFRKIKNKVPHDGGTIDGVWIGDRIYRTLTDPRLQIIITVSPIHTL
jgi:hypothetical protein